MRSRHAPYTRPRPRLPPMALSHENIRQRDTKHTAVHALYCSMCLAVLRIPTCAPTELPATSPKRTLPMPTRAGTKPNNRKPPRLRGPPWPSSSFRLMRDRTPSLMASLWASSSSSSSRTHHHHACHAFLASRHVPTSRRARRRPPYHASNTSNARRPVWSFGHLVIWSSFSRAVGPRRTCRCIHRQIRLRGDWRERGAATGRHAAAAPFPP